MKLAIMQPYLFPYIGYFQLIQSVDAFVLYDDVNYMKGGWINRNFILLHGRVHRITLQLQGASPNVLINQVQVGNNRIKLLKSIYQAYSKAPLFEDVFPIVERILLYEEKNLAKFLDYCLRQICGYLDLKPTWYISSQLNKDNALRGQDKVLAICRELHADHYINLPGGRGLYEREIFEQRGIRLSFLHPFPYRYHQWGGEFVPNLSIIDVMMFNDQKQCGELLREYSLD